MSDGLNLSTLQMKCNRNKEIPQYYGEWRQIAQEKHRQRTYQEDISYLIAAPAQILEFHGEHGNLRYQKV